MSDAYVVYMNNVADYVIKAPDFATVEAWLMSLMGKYQEKIQKYTWTIFAEVSAE